MGAAGAIALLPEIACTRMSDLRFPSVPAAFASAAPARRDADSRADGSFAMALDEVAAANDAVPVRAGSEPAPGPTGPGEPIVTDAAAEPAEPVQTSESVGAVSPGLAAQLPLAVALIAPLVPAVPDNAMGTDSPLPETGSATASPPAPVAAGEDVGPAPAAPPPPSGPLPLDPGTTGSTPAGQTASASAPPVTAAGLATSTKGNAAGGPAPALNEVTGASGTGNDLAADALRSGQALAADQAARADDAALASLVAEAERATRGRSVPGTVSAPPLQTAAPATTLPVADPKTVEGNDSDGPDAFVAAGTDLPLEERPSASLAAPMAEGPRTRDVIDRASAGRPGGSSETPVAQPETGTSSTEARTPAASLVVTSVARPALAPVADGTSGPLNAVEPADAPSPLLAPTDVSASEARAAEAVETLSLSTTSRASIETTAQIAAQIVRKLEGRSTRFEMALTPEGLGQVDVSLDIDADGKLAARLAFDNPLAATELRGRVDELRRQLQEAGFTVADDALSFSQRDASAGQGGQFDRRPDARNARAFGAASRISAEADLAATPPRWMSLTLTPDRVDMKV